MITRIALPPRLSHLYVSLVSPQRVFDPCLVLFFVLFYCQTKICCIGRFRWIVTWLSLGSTLHGPLSGCPGR